MKKFLLLLPLLGFMCAVNAQNTIESISLGKDVFNRDSVPRPLIRQVVGGTVIHVLYEGSEWDENLERKNAFEHACRIIEEQIPTAPPILVKVNFGALRGNNALARTNMIYLPADRGAGYFPRATLKRLMYDSSRYYGLTIDFINEPDGEITFSTDDIFSYSLDYVTENKYDFVTVALRELCKVFGFGCTIKGDNVNKTLKMDDSTPLLPFDLEVLGGSQKDKYVYATSGNAKFGYGGLFKMYSPPIFENMRSLSYFTVDEQNVETRLMQPDLPRGTSIRYVGKWFKTMLDEMDWAHSVLVGSGGSAPVPGTISTGELKPFGETISLSANRTLSNVERTINTEQISSREVIDVDLTSYIRKFSDFPCGVDGWPLVAWCVTILKKDGTWDLVADAFVNASNIQFSTEMIDVNKIDEYARSSDGYLRCKVSRSDFTLWQSHTSKEYVNYFLLDYLPQKVQMAFSKVMPQTRAVDDEYYVDVKIGFKNVEGTDRILVEQLEEGAQVPFTYFVENVANGYFIATVDKEYKTTFRLRALNKNGETISEQLTLLPLNPVTYTLGCTTKGDILELQFANSRGRNATDKELLTYKIVDLTNSIVLESGRILNNVVDISSLNTGLYGIQVVDKDAKSYSAKFMK